MKVTKANERALDTNTGKYCSGHTSAIAATKLAVKTEVQDKLVRVEKTY